MNEPIYLFYEEPDPDRWFKFDRYPRKVIRRLLRGETKPGGVMRWYLNLRRGLDLLGVKYRINDYKALRKNPQSWACVVGKSHVIDKIPPSNPIMYGPGIAAHPYENDFWDKANIKLILISCDWFQQMYARDLPVSIPTSIWPAGIESDIWQPSSNIPELNRVMVYDKIRWQREIYEKTLIRPIIDQLESVGISIDYYRYGSYKEENYQKSLQQVRGMIFLCEHETQGFAYLQALASGVAILAWDRGGFWQDPSMFPHLVKFQPVTSVPYFNEQCGEKFVDFDEFKNKLPKFLHRLSNQSYEPRRYIIENFDLANRALEYIRLLRKAQNKTY